MIRNACKYQSGNQKSYAEQGLTIQWPKEKWQTMTKRKMTNNDQKKNDKQWPKEKGQTMTKRKMTNNDQKKKDKQWSTKHYTDN
jgi:hypothetical protein